LASFPDKRKHANFIAFGGEQRIAAKFSLSVFSRAPREKPIIILGEQLRTQIQLALLNQIY